VELLTGAGVRWLSARTGEVGPLDLVESGTGVDLAGAFDPTWISRELGRFAA